MEKHLPSRTHRHQQQDSTPNFTIDPSISQFISSDCYKGLNVCVAKETFVLK